MPLVFLMFEFSYYLTEIIPHKQQIQTTLSNMSVARLALQFCFVLSVNSLAFRNMYPDKRWPKDRKTGHVKIPWRMHCSGTSQVALKSCEKAKAVASKAAETLSKNTCIRLQYTPNPPADYIGVVTNKGCASAVGKMGGRQMLSLEGQGCATERTAIHEFMHALGFSHEQERPDRDNYITINMDNVQHDQEHNFMKSVDSKTLGLPYDYYSIMHYRRSAFSTNGRDTIITKDRSKQNVIGERRGPSQLDYDKINKLYGCRTTSVPINFNFSFTVGTKSLEDCKKDYNRCKKRNRRNCSTNKRKCESNFHDRI